jgi:TonB-linked SusC/RagA family outer membrane protein
MKLAAGRSWVSGALCAFALLVLGAGTAEAQQASIAGRVTAQGSNEALSDVRVLLVGTSVFAVTNAEGRYTLRSVPVGTAEVRVLRVGYIEQKRAVTVTAGESATLDFSMQQAVVRLQEVVTTATGEQRRTELGNTVATIDAASKIEEAPIKNMGDLLVAKAPGVQVLPANMTGGGSRVRIRGTASLSLNNDPIYIIDGIRMTSRGSDASIGVGGTSPSRVNDINPEEIENIEIVKGPSAATLYGTDAANGVIVITTKKGRAGAAQWTIWGERGIIEDRNDYPDQYAILGHTTASPGAASVRCFMHQVGGGTCTPDENRRFSVLEDPDISPIVNGARNNVGLQVSGGTEQVRYFISGDVEGETGPFRMPAYDRRRFESLRIGVREEWDRPNALMKSSVRANINAAITPTLDVSVQSGFVKSDQRLPQVDNNVNSFWYNALTGPGFKTAGPGYLNEGSLGQPLNGYNLFTPGDIFQAFTTQGVQRFIGSANASWRPLTWLQARADVGVDLTDRVEFGLCRFEECPDFSTNRLGSAEDARANLRNFTSNLGATASWQARDWVGLKTTAGAQYVNFKYDNNDAFGEELPPGAQTPSQGTIPNVGTSTTLQTTLGLFVEEQAAIRDRLFLTAAIRTDQNSAFGTNFQRVYYPKAAISWIISEENFFPVFSWLNQFRLRSSVGASGVQPGPNDALRTFQVTSTNIAGEDVSGLRTNQLGNPELKPERATEYEAGFDARFLNNKVNFEATYYSKLSKDALINKPLAGSAGAQVTSVVANLGKMKNAGVEAMINAQLVDRQLIGWDVTVSGSHNSNKLVSLGEGVPAIIGNTIQQRPGYPVNGYWHRPFTYSDANNDGFITASEITIPDSATFIGYSQPRDEVAISTGVELFKRRLRLNALGDYKGGSSLLNSEQQFLCSQAPSCEGTSSPDATLFEQARAVAQRFMPTGALTSQAGYIEPLQFWRIRELSATVTLPERFASRYLRARSGGLTFAVRNLATFTKYTGVDPEANYGQGDTQQTLLTAGPPTYYQFRLSLAF